jgi:hypothetical protein
MWVLPEYLLLVVLFGVSGMGVRAAEGAAMVDLKAAHGRIGSFEDGLLGGVVHI